MVYLCNQIHRRFVGAVVQTTIVGTAWSKIPGSGPGDRGFKSHPPHYYNPAVSKERQNTHRFTSDLAFVSDSMRLLRILNFARDVI